MNWARIDANVHTIGDTSISIDASIHSIGNVHHCVKIVSMLTAYHRRLLIVDVNADRVIDWIYLVVNASVSIHYHFYLIAHFQISMNASRIDIDATREHRNVSTVTVAIRALVDMDSKAAVVYVSVIVYMIVD
jgi:hypothetical protein